MLQKIFGTNNPKRFFKHQEFTKILERIIQNSFLNTKKLQKFWNE